MKKRAIYRALFILSILMTFISIGGGCGSNDYAGGGIGGTGISVGKITAFGSVFVNGVEFDTSRAGITKDGISGLDERDLEIGMVVTVRGAFDANGITGTASSIEYNDNLEGPINSINTVIQTLTVLGQTVHVDNTTVFNPSSASLTTLSQGNIIEVSGFAGADGKTIYATYIELKAADFIPGTTEIEIKGTVSSLNNNTFTIGNLTVDYSSAQLEVPGGSLSNGLYVEVKSIDGFDNTGTLIASKVEAEEAVPGYQEGDRVEFEGYVTEITSPTEFKVNGQSVQTTSQTRYENGTAVDITIDARLEVDGTVNANGVLIAEEISFENEGDIGGSSEENNLSGTDNTAIDTSTDGESISNNEIN